MIAFFSIFENNVSRISLSKLSEKIDEINNCLENYKLKVNETLKDKINYVWWNLKWKHSSFMFFILKIKKNIIWLKVQW